MLKELYTIREEIDKIDDEIILLLKKRFNLVLKISELKKNSKMDIIDEKREEIVIKRGLEVLNCNNLSKYIKEVIKSIIYNSRRIQEDYSNDISNK